MPRQGTYYLGRVLKLGTLDQAQLIRAIKEPISVESRGNSWTFIDVEESTDKNNHYIFGRLSKYKPQGEVVVVDTKKRTEETQIEPNLRIATSTFVYIPEHSGIAFLNVGNHIEQSTFINKFCAIVEKTYDNFFVDCNIEMVSDLRSFSAKVSSLDGIYEVKARVSPPNPLFGPLWEDLKNYLISRNTDRMNIDEESPESTPINTNLPEIIKNASEQTEDEPYFTSDPIPVGDAAILMAADGYGNGLVRGKSGNEFITIKTSETAKNFSFEKDPEPEALYLKAKKIFDSIKEKRHLSH